MSSYMARLLSVSRPNDLADETEALARALRKTKSEVVRDALRRHLLGFDEPGWLGVKDLLIELAAEIVPPPEGKAEPVTGDPSDDIILACATEAQVDVLVSVIGATCIRWASTAGSGSSPRMRSSLSCVAGEAVLGSFAPSANDRRNI